MPLTTLEHRRNLERLDRPGLARHQWLRLQELLAAVLPGNRFYREKFDSAPLPLASIDELASLPFTTKDELLGGTLESGFAANLTFAPEHYVRYHRTSGTRGRPLAVLDTPADWQWWIEGWQFVLDAAEISSLDRVLLAFSFGPFIGFWSAFDAAAARGALIIPTGGMSTLARLDLLRSARATAVFCTPSYALHLADVAAENSIDLRAAGVRCLVVAGEPGGSIPATRQRIESAWHARVIDHAGATEVGPWGYADAAGRGLFVNESEFIAEFLSVATGAAAVEGELAELVLTSLGRFGCPVIRYRTGDLVRPVWDHGLENRFVLLDGGVLGRADDMLVIRGVNVFPSSVEAVLRGFPEIREFRVTARRDGALDVLSVEIEDDRHEPARVSRELQLRLGLNVDVRCAPAGSLPRFEGKGNRFVDERTAPREPSTADYNTRANSEIRAQTRRLQNDD